jgi:hypothetical protein
MVLPLAALAMLVLVFGLTTSVGAETRCNRGDDGLPCDEAERLPINPDSASRLSPWRSWPSDIDGPRDDWMLDGARIYSSDGRVCWPHGDHFHCAPPRLP